MHFLNFIDRLIGRSLNKAYFSLSQVLSNLNIFYCKTYRLITRQKTINNNNREAEEKAIILVHSLLVKGCATCTSSVH